MPVYICLYYASVGGLRPLPTAAPACLGGVLPTSLFVIVFCLCLFVFVAYVYVLLFCLGVLPTSLWS